MATIYDTISLLREGRRPEIVQFASLERGNLRVGYLGGRYAFIASLYDHNLSNQLFQLHYQDYLLDRGKSFVDPDAFVAHVRSLDLDYICIFDTEAPGARILMRYFPDKVFIEDIYK